MKNIFIINPTAGKKDCTEAVRSAAADAFSAYPGEEYELYVTTAPGDAEAKVRSLGESGEEMRVFCCGGDGTFNECVNGAAGFLNLALAPYPVGTGNDFCRMFDDQGSGFLDLPSMITGSVHPIDLIDCNGRYSACICSVGFDARVGCNVHKYSSIPFVFGKTAYVISLIVELFKGLNRKMHILCNGMEYTGKFALVSVCNGRFYGGGFMPSRDAMPDDNELDMYIIKKADLLKLALNIGKYASGRSDEIPNLITHLKGDRIRIEFDRSEVINADGETLIAPVADMHVVPGVLRLLIPRGLKFFPDTANA